MSTKQLCEIPISVLNLCPIVAGGTPADSFRNSLDLAQHATEADEIIVNAQIFDHQARMRSYEILAEVVGGDS